jgi:hypothetical protein
MGDGDAGELFPLHAAVRIARIIAPGTRKNFISSAPLLPVNRQRRCRDKKRALY